jgi:hypothetical protein
MAFASPQKIRSQVLPAPPRSLAQTEISRFIEREGFGTRICHRTESPDGRCFDDNGDDAKYGVREVVGRFGPQALGNLAGLIAARCRAEGPTFRAAKCAHLGASAQGRLRGPSDRHHAARPGDSKSQEAAQRP